ncbi:hypothetical protein CLOP_g13152 [Closterium sp. NIES-67]|nr:hypothetical protein CLOP_g13152 [Closterium sp. NIES-67]
MGWIEPSASPYGAPILFVNEMGRGLRMCVDYRALNKITVKNRYPLPRIEDLFDRLQRAQWFSALDLAQGYHQLRITEEDVPKTAFRTPFGHFQWRVLSLGLTNAPASFQRAMNDVYREAIGQFVLVYLEDILVYCKIEKEHTQHLKWVLGKLRKHKFYARLWKCHFYKHELEYLGHIVGNDGLKVDPKKVSAVQQWPVPQDVGQVRSFLGLANYFRRFLDNYSSVVAPLTALTRKRSAWQWTDQCQKAFDEVKTMLTNAPVLALPDPSKPYEVVTDASTVGIGAVLLQEGRPVAFESRKLSPAEQRYTTSEQELLAVVHALRTWHCYLEGVDFVVTTDHCPKTYFATQATLIRRQARWAELLSGFTYDIRYRASSTNMADPLSRQPIGTATAVRLAEAQINADDQLLPDYSVQVVPVNTSLSTTQAAAAVSYSAMDPSPSAASYPFFARTIRSDALEMQAIADLVAHFSWLEVITIYSDDDYGRNGVNQLTVLLDKVGMMTPGYVWIATEGVVSELENLPELSTEGVIGTRVFVPPNAQLSEFERAWQADGDGNATAGAAALFQETTLYALFAHDSLSLIARGLHSVLYPNSPSSSYSSPSPPPLPASNASASAMGIAGIMAGAGVESTNAGVQGLEQWQAVRLPKGGGASSDLAKLQENLEGAKLMDAIVRTTFDGVTGR